MRKLPLTAAADLLKIITRRYERVSTMPTSSRPVEDWGKLRADVTAASSMLERLLDHGHVLKRGPAVGERRRRNRMRRVKAASFRLPQSR